MGALFFLVAAVMLELWAWHAFGWRVALVGAGLWFLGHVGGFTIMQDLLKQQGYAVENRSDMAGRRRWRVGVLPSKPKAEKPKDPEPEWIIPLGR